MADDLLTVGDHIADALDLAPREISDLIDDASFLMELPMEESSNGTTHKYAKETGAPVVGFRAENLGREYDHGEDTVVSVSLEILDISSRCDVAVANGSPKGRDVVIARQIFRHLKAGLFGVEKQIFQGTGADAAGFNGLPDDAALDGLADDMVTSAGGTPVGAVTSCYLIRLGENDVSGVMVPDNPIELMETTVIEAEDGTGKKYPAYYTPGSSWVGLQIGGKYSVGRICNIDPTGATGTFDDDVIIDAIENFPGGEPHLIVMNRSARKLLRKSRTATTTSGKPANIPTDVEGIPVLKTEALLDTEAVVA